MASRFRKYRKELPAIASGLAVLEFKGNFKRGGYRTGGGTVEQWRPRQMDKGAKRAILIKTGRLRSAIKAAPTYTHARVVNATPYAAIHNRGGDIKGHARVWATGVKSKLTRLRSNPQGPKATMPARPFMITTKPLLDDISAEILEGLETVFKGAKSA